MTEYVRKPTTYKVFDLSEMPTDEDIDQALVAHFTDMWDVNRYVGPSGLLFVFSGKKLVEVARDGKFAYLPYDLESITTDFSTLVPYEELYGPRA